MNKEAYFDKNESYFSSVRRDILSMIPAYSSRIMEIGCGDGSTLNYLKSSGYCAWTCGVELFPKAAEIAQGRVDNVYLSNIETKDLPIEESSLDLILCLDVLEHLVRPTDVVEYLHKLLAPNGLLIASIPNIRHYSVIVPLLFQGKWDYRNEGILDETHLRFFVKDTAIKLMTSSGLKLVEIKSNGGSGKIFHILKYLTLGIIQESFFEYQFLIKVQRDDK